MCLLANVGIRYSTPGSDTRPLPPPPFLPPPSTPCPAPPRLFDSHSESAVQLGPSSPRTAPHQAAQGRTAPSLDGRTARGWAGRGVRTARECVASTRLRWGTFREERGESRALPKSLAGAAMAAIEASQRGTPGGKSGAPTSHEVCHLNRDQSRKFKNVCKKKFGKMLS